MPTPLPITDRPIRVAVVGLGQIAELVLPPYLKRDDVEIVAMCDRDPERLDRWSPEFPDAAVTTDLAAMLTLEADVVDVLVPTPYHADVACQVLDAGFHLHIQKPLARNLEGADRILAAAARTGAVVRVMEDYLFYPPLAKLMEIVASGDIGVPAGVHMKIVATGRGGWDVPLSSYIWQFEQAKDGRGMLVFDHGWHQLAVAHAMFGPIRRIFGWLGETPAAPELAPELMIDAPSTLVWEHDNGVRGVLDITFAPDTYFRSDFYTGDERVEVTGTAGYARCNRISALGVQEPAVVVYREGEMHSFHALDDDPRDGFDASAAHFIQSLRTGDPAPIMTGAVAREVLCALITGIESAQAGRPLDVPRN